MTDSPFRPVGPLAATLRASVRGARRARLTVTTRGRFSSGRRFAVGARAVVKSPRQIRFGDDVAIGREFYTDVDIDCGSDVLISSRVAIVGNDHRFDDPARTLTTNGRFPPALVKLGGDNLIGFGSIIVGPVEIGRGCIVGAGSVVVSDLPPYTVCAGVPARPIRARFEVPDVRG